VLSLQLAHLAKLNLNILSVLARFQPNKSRYQKLLAKKFAGKETALCGGGGGRIPLFVPSTRAPSFIVPRELGAYSAEAEGVISVTRGQTLCAYRIQLAER
jgi:hypothetical protein